VSAACTQNSPRRGTIASRAILCVSWGCLHTQNPPRRGFRRIQSYSVCVLGLFGPPGTLFTHTDFAWTRLSTHPELFCVRPEPVRTHRIRLDGAGNPRAVHGCGHRCPLVSDMMRTATLRSRHSSRVGGESWLVDPGTNLQGARWYCQHR